ncbi:MAG: queuosine precursor transporter [Pseudomonadota bacterium]
MTKSYLPGVFAMAAVVVASNILVQFLLGQWLTWGALTFPIAFLVTDVMNRVYGASAARRVIFAGFLVGVICSLVGSQIMLQGDGFSYPAVALRVAIGSGVAFLVAQLIDVFVFDKLRDGAWWRAPLFSSVVGSALDTAIFFSIAFSQTVSFGAAADGEVSWAWEALPLLGSGPESPLWVSLAVADWLVKMSVALIALIPFRMITARLSGAQIA